ncbi:MAG: HlyD family efflux transporter periplasmic adaptor subunit, partial [Candidatus Eisenbacteria bacterium]
GRAGATARAAAPVARAGVDLADAAALHGWLASPLGGRVLTAHPAGLVGRRFAAGETVLEVGSTDELAVLFLAGEREVGDLAPGRVADLRLRAAPARALRIAIESVDSAPRGDAVLARPAARLVDDTRAARQYVAHGRLANADGALRPGMSGRARIPARPLNLLARGARFYARLVRADFWL